MAFWENYLATRRQRMHRAPGHGGFPSVLIASSLAISKRSTSLPSSQAATQKHVCLAFPPFQSCGLRSIPNQHCPVNHRDASLIRHRTSQPTPFKRKSTKAYSIYFNLRAGPPLESRSPVSNQRSLGVPTRPEQQIWSSSFEALSLLTVGKPVCLVLLCLISARRDKGCPQYRVRNWRNTSHLRSLQKPHGRAEISAPPLIV
jgi:hypothetical protein